VACGAATPCITTVLSCTSIRYCHDYRTVNDYSIIHYSTIRVQHYGSGVLLKRPLVLYSNGQAQVCEFLHRCRKVQYRIGLYVVCCVV